MSTQLLARAENHLPPNVLFPLEKVRDYFAKANETVQTPSIASKWIKQAREYHHLVDQGFIYVEPYTPNLNKQNVVFLLLLLLCFEGKKY